MSCCKTLASISLSHGRHLFASQPPPGGNGFYFICVTSLQPLDFSATYLCCPLRLLGEQDLCHHPPTWMIPGEKRRQQRRTIKHLWRESSRLRIEPSFEDVEAASVSSDPRFCGTCLSEKRTKDPMKTEETTNTVSDNTHAAERNKMSLDASGRESFRRGRRRRQGIDIYETILAEQLGNLTDPPDESSAKEGPGKPTR